MTTPRSHRRRSPVLAVLAALAVQGLAGCAAASRSPEASPAALAARDEARPIEPGGAPGVEVAGAALAALPAPPSGAKAAEAPTAAAPARAKSAPAVETTDDAIAPRIVYQGELALRVDAGTGPGAVDAVVALAEAAGGHLAGRDEGRVVVKIPSRRFRETMSRIEADFQVERRNVRAEDVTAEFHDLEVRLANLAATRRRLEQLLERSATLGDTLTVERELERVTAEIDRIQGRLRFLRAHTALSTLTVQVVEREAARPVTVATPSPRRDLALPLSWVDRVGVDALLQVPADE